MDRISRKHRSWNMSRIRSRDTKPERVVRSSLHRLGYRFRLRPQKLPGSPDVVLTRHKTVVFVHGCFWHRHHECKLAYTPKSRRKFWIKKFAETVARDRRAIRSLKRMGWIVFTVWECEIAQPHKLKQFLKGITRHD